MASYKGIVHLGTRRRSGHLELAGESSFPATRWLLRERAVGIWEEREDEWPQRDEQGREMEAEFFDYEQRLNAKGQEEKAKSSGKSDKLNEKGGLGKTITICC